MKRTKEHLETQFRNMRFGHYKPDVVQAQLKELLVVSSPFFKTREGIAGDRRLTPEGKIAARREAAQAVIAEITKWKERRLSALDADIAVQRAALLPPSTEKIEPRRIELLLARLQAFTPAEVATLYGSATDDERVVMEAASASAGRVPIKSERGIEWRPLLDAQTVAESVLARAQSKNPAAAAKLAEIQEIRDMHATAANIAIAEIKES